MLQNIALLNQSPEGSPTQNVLNLTNYGSDPNWCIQNKSHTRDLLPSPQKFSYPQKASPEDWGTIRNGLHANLFLVELCSWNVKLNYQGFPPFLISPHSLSNSLH